MQRSESSLATVNLEEGLDDGDDTEGKPLRERREIATGKLKAKGGGMNRSSSAASLSSFKKLEARKAETIAWSGVASYPPRLSATHKEEAVKKEPTTFRLPTEYDGKDTACFTAQIRTTSREDHLYYHIEVKTFFTSWVVKRRESELLTLWATLTEHKVQDLPPRPRRSTAISRRSADDIAKRMVILQELLVGILSNKRALQVRATQLFLELYRALL